jgi:hypothetical protein
MITQGNLRSCELPRSRMEEWRLCQFGVIHRWRYKSTGVSTRPRGGAAGFEMLFSDTQQAHPCGSAFSSMKKTV